MNHDGPIIVTGVSSFVGAHLARYLAEKGLRVIGTHSRDPDSYTGLTAERLSFAESTGATLAVLDLSDGPGAVALIEKVQPTYWVSHAGWTQDYTESSYDLMQGHVTEVAASEVIFAALRRVGCRGVVSTGSVAEYGNNSAGCREDDNSWPEQPYGLSKLCKSIRYRQLARRHGIPVRVARIFFPFGILDVPGRLVASAADALGRGEPLEVSPEHFQRDFLGIRDLCRGYLALLNDCDRDSLFDVFNICSGQPVTIGEFLRELASQMHADPGLLRFGARPQRPYEIEHSFGDMTKARAHLEWQPEPWRDAVRRYLDELTAYRERPRPSGATRLPVVRLSRSSIHTHSMSRVTAVLQRAQLGMGAEVDCFERELAAYVGGDRQVMCVSTGTAALHLALQAIGIGPGDEVLVPTLTYVASFQAVSATGATPVACDVRAEDGWLDVADAARRITPRTRAIMPVHYASGSGALAEVYALAEQHGLRVIEDAAHAFGCTWRDARIGSFGDIVCFSFDGIKNITSGEGGAVVTSDAEVAERVKSARLLGVLKDTETRYAGRRSWDFDVTAQGWRYHMSNINAALGRAQLRRLDSVFAPRRVERARRYAECLAGMPDVRLLPLDYGPVVPHIFPVIISGGKRDAIREALRVVNIESGIHYKPNHLLSYYGGGATSLPVAERLHAGLLSLPLHAELTDNEQDRVLAVLERILR